MKRFVFAYGLALALLALLLNSLHYYYFVHHFSAEIYFAVVALLFTGIGIWAGQKLTQTGAARQHSFRTNHKALSSLGITDRELEVLQLLAEGLSNQQIADRLFISIHTVKSHVSSVLGKMGVRRRTQAVREARTLRIIR